MPRPLLMLLMTSFTLMLAACSPSAKITPPIAADEPLPTGTLQEVRLGSSLLERVSQQIASEKDHKLHSMLVLRGGLLVFEEYYNGYTRHNSHDIRSATKSVTSLLTGVAIERGAVAGIDAPLMDYLGEDYPDVQDKDDLLLRHLLTMRSGLDCDDQDRSTRGQEDRMYRAKDWVGYFLSLSRTDAPGERTRYCTGGVVALGEAIAQGAEQDFADFAEDALFEPLGIRNYRWARFDDGRKTDTGGHLLLTPQGMAKIGLLVLQEGRWHERQIVSSRWLERSTHPHTEIDGVPYGYLWWHYSVNYGEKSVEVIAARGNGGQVILIVPEFEVVSVFTAGYYNDERARIPFDIFFNAVLPSVEELRPYLPEPPNEP